MSAARKPRTSLPRAQKAKTTLKARLDPSSQKTSDKPSAIVSPTPSPGFTRAVERLSALKDEMSTWRQPQGTWPEHEPEMIGPGRPSFGKPSGD